MANEKKKDKKKRKKEDKKPEGEPRLEAFPTPDKTGSDLWFWGEDWLETEEGGPDIIGALRAVDSGDFDFLRPQHKEEEETVTKKKKKE